MTKNVTMETSGITEQELMTKNFIFGPKFQNHKFYKKNIYFIKPPKKEDQTEEEYEVHVKSLTSLYNLYKNTVQDRVGQHASQSYNFHFYRGELYESYGEYGKALSDFDLAIENFDKLLSAFLGKGRILLYTGKTKEALKQFEIALDMAGRYYDDSASCCEYVINNIETSLKKNTNRESQPRIEEWLSSSKVKLAESI